MKILIFCGFLFSEPRITLDVERADITTVLRTIGKVGNVNIVTTPNVKGEVSVHLRDVPWKDALIAVLEANGYGFIEEKGIIKVMTIAEYENIQRTLRIREKIYKVKYADAEGLQKVIQPLISPFGVIQYEKRTNSLMIRDSDDKLKRIEELIEEIDKPQPQVRISAKIAKIDYKVAQELGIKWLLDTKENPFAKTQFRAEFSQQVANPAFRLEIGKLVGETKVDLLLSTLEQMNKAQILTEPSVLVTNNDSATILDGKKIPIITLDIAGNRIIRFYEVALKLWVSPQITPDSNLILNLHVEIADLSGEATPAGEPIILSSEIKTSLHVKNSETIVIGGILRDRNDKVKRGIPIIMHLPVIGTLFSYNANVKDKTEMMIFITPEIVRRI